MNFSDQLPAPNDLAAHVRRRAASYFPEMTGQPVRVRAGSMRRRPLSGLCKLSVTSGSSTKRVLAKIALSLEGPSGAATGVSSRFLTTADPPGSEFNALTTLAEHLAATGDPRFFAVRVLDSLLDDRVLVLELVEARSLTQRLLAASRLGGGRRVPELLETLQRSGACLHTLHAMPRGANRRPRGVAKQEFLAWVDATEALVAGHRFSRRFFDDACPRLRRLAEQVLPEELPLGPLHDDFAPRNVLVNSAGQVAVIDMLQEWVGCVWEDVAHFLYSLSVNKPQALTGGCFFSASTVEQFRSAFLAGYFGQQAVPRTELLIYECQTTLNAWAAQWRRLAADPSWRAAPRRCRFELASRWYAKHADECLRRAELLSAAPRPLATVAGGLLSGEPS